VVNFRLSEGRLASTQWLLCTFSGITTQSYYIKLSKLEESEFFECVRDYYIAFQEY